MAQATLAYAGRLQCRGCCWVLSLTLSGSSGPSSQCFQADRLPCPGGCQNLFGQQLWCWTCASLAEVRANPGAQTGRFAALLPPASVKRARVLASAERQRMRIRCGSILARKAAGSRSGWRRRPALCAELLQAVYFSAQDCTRAWWQRTCAAAALRL
jgi:hypothetical protein